MKNCFFKAATLGVVTLLAACTSEMDNLGTNQDGVLPITRSAEGPSYVVEDGCINFNSGEAYAQTLTALSGKTDEELIAWSDKQGIYSLLKSYQQENSVEVKSEESEEMEDTENYEMASAADASLFNKNGLLIINDTIYKVIKEYVYCVPNRDWEMLKDVESAPETYTSIRYQHTQRLQPVSLTRTSVEAGERSHLIQVTSKRREHVKFNVSLSVNGVGLIFLNMEMVGRAQKKKLWWGQTFNDEMVWGQINCHGIIVENLPGVIGNTFPAGSSPVVRNQKKVNLISPSLGPANYVRHVRATINFSFCKNVVKGDQSYTHEYRRTNN